MKTNSISASLAVHARTIATTRHLIFRRACLWTGFLAFATIAFGPQPAQAAVTEAWVQRYGSQAGSSDAAYKVVTDAAGNVIVAGYAGNQTGRELDTLIIKYSGAGVPLWTNRYNGYPAYAVAVAVDASGNVFVTGSDYATIAYSGAGVLLWTNRYGGSARAVAVDGSGNVFVTGSSYDNGGHSDYATIAYSGAGVPLWTNRYNGPANGSDQATAMAVDASGNVFVTGWSIGIGGNEDYATIAYSGAGVPLWTNRYNGPANGYDQATAVAVDASGNVFVTGYSFGSGGNEDYATIAYSGAGVPLWTKRYNGPYNIYDYATAVAVDGSGNVFVTGWSGHSVEGGSINDYATIAYSSAGVPLWTNRYNGTASAMAVDGSGNVFVTGSSDGFYATIAYSGAGVPLWTNRYNGGNGTDIAKALAVHASGNVFVTGSSVGSGGDSDYATIAYSSAGVPLWTNRYNGTSSASDEAIAVAVDGSGNVFVTGYSFGIRGYEDYATIAYSSAGVPLWTNLYNGPANSSDRATAVVVDGSGNVFVTGSSVGSGEDWDYATIAYSGAGVPLWTSRYNGTANGDDVATAVAVDASGNVFVTGSSTTIAYSGAGVPLWTNGGSGTAIALDGTGNVFVTGGGFTTIAYSGAGVPLWTNLYNGPANDYDQANAVAVDGGGNVFVTGSSDSDYATIAYSGAGVPLWTNRYNGPVNARDEARAVAVDGNGNVVVTGTSNFSVPPFAGVSRGGIYYTAKYASADGALLWEKSYNGPANGADFANWSRSLALGPNGMIAVTGSFSDDYATVVYRDVPAVSIDLISTGVRLRVTGLPGRSYNIERTPALTGPWSTINTQTAPASGAFEYLDTNSPAAAAFYRTREP